jgi:cation diffusion facilitator family transporter
MSGGHDHEHGLRQRIKHAITPHSHDSAVAVDSALETSDRGPRALLISLAVLGVTAGAQAVVAGLSGSVALLGDTLHNTADALTAVPLGLAFWIGRRPATRRYTYGYGRAEDMAGVVIVVLIAASSALAAYEAVRRLTHSQDVHHLWAVALAGVLGFVGNEVVARYRIKVGREIGSAALVADGLHARTDGFTSLSVVVGAGGVAIGWKWADPVVGLLITVAILIVLRDAAKEIYRRLMDAVDPSLVDQVDHVLEHTDGVIEVGITRLRWIGHQLRAECTVVVDSGLTVIEGHRIAEECEHRLLHELPRLTAAMVHADVAGGTHELTAHHT